MIRNCARKILSRFLIARVDVKMLGEIGVHFDFGETNDLRREFDKWQATLPHEVINRPPADVQTPGHLRLRFVIRRRGDLVRFRVHFDMFTTIILPEGDATKVSLRH